MTSTDSFIIAAPETWRVSHYETNIHNSCLWMNSVYYSSSRIMRRMPPRQANSTLEPVLRACRLLQSFQDRDDILRVNELTKRTGLHKATVSRLLLALQSAGMVERIGRRGYRSHVQILRRRKLKIGYASQTEQSLFAREVTASLRRAAASQQVELLTLDNAYDAATTLRNVEGMIAAGVDVAIEFQTFESVAQLISSKFQQAKIPLISVDMPYPGATFYGGNNYEAGLIAGHALGHWTRDHWDGVADEVILIELPTAGPLPQLRLTAGHTGLQDVLPSIAKARVVHLDGGNTLKASFEAVKRHMRSTRAKRTLVMAINDPGALGALQAFEQAGRLEHCAVMGQGATLDARAELRRDGSRLIGSVAYFPERYGEALVRVALDIIEKKSLPPAIYTKHKVITAANVDRFYPDDPTK